MAEETSEPTEPPTAIPTLAPYRSPTPRPPARLGLGSHGDAAEGSWNGRFTLLRALGSGAMAHVYLARERGDAGFERLVAIKVMRDVYAADPRLVDLFLDEARLACQLRHPNIVAVTDLVRTGGEYVIVMEYVEGADLRRLIRRVTARQERIPVPLALTIARRLCDGLHHAHTAVDAHGQPLGLVHRDVKCANVIVSLSGSVKIADFGVARVAGRLRSSTTAIGQVKGTPAYMAPEQSTGGVVDHRADVYALGAIAYELFTGSHINLDPARIGHLGARGWPHLPPPSAVRPELPAELDGVIIGAMAFDPADRHPDCERLELALAEIARRHGLSADDKDIARWVRDELASP
jgi:serine/threonine-protein kinase